MEEEEVNVSKPEGGGGLATPLNCLQKPLFSVLDIPEYSKVMESNVAPISNNISDRHRSKVMNRRLVQPY